ncbi:hypothetical protein CP977_00950 [Streptomyces cinereoruber]|uniref:ATP-binding protein n=1 Tax=Streptomyces cinereoruber TaxID=67260 RepID=A0ABX6BAC1_9ACTN|nr:hypothetical protein CP977_00950 [Streptomyces cinereoruber]
MSASGDGAVAVGGDAGFILNGHYNTVLMVPGYGGPRTLDDLAAAGRARMVQRWHAVGVPLDVACTFADTAHLGSLPSAMVTSPEGRVVVLEGSFGAGKSLAAERKHQQDITAARTDARAPIPVHLHAKHIQGGVVDAAIRAARPFGDPAARGIALVVDGLDEPGPIRGKELLDQGLSWTASTAGQRWHILFTVRPGLELNDSVRRIMPDLGEDETALLIDRLGGNGSAVGSQPSMVRHVLRRPLFAIIAAGLQRDRSPLPHSPMAFLQALVTRAVRDAEEAKEERAERLLQKLATECASTGGLAAAADVGSPGDVHALLGTRLVVRVGERHLAFALPVLEQYFTGQALLAGGVPADVTQNVELLDRWRYGLAMAVASAGWEAARTVIEPLLRAQPGIAAWVVHEAVPRAVPESEGPWPDMATSLVSQRLQATLEAWQQGLGPAGDLIFFYTRWSGPVTVDARLKGNKLGLHILRRHADHTPELAIPVSHRRAEPHGMRPLAASARPVAADYAAWPWQETLGTVASRLHMLCERRDFDLADCDAYTKERLWLASTGLLRRASRRYAPLQADEAHQALRQSLYSAGRLPVRSSYGHQFSGRQVELLRIDEQLGGGRWADDSGMLHYPYAAPDQEDGPHVHWVWDTYSPSQLRLRTEQVLSAAMEIYTALVDTWFPHLKQVLGLASACPATLVADLYVAPPQDSDSYEPPLMRLSLRPSTGSSVSVHLVPSEDDLYAPAPPLSPGNEPARSPWARPSTPVISEPEIFDDAPAIGYAYAWLHEDLHRLHLTSHGPGRTNSGLP